MGFFDSLLAWFILVLVITFILFALFSYFLGLFYHQEDIESSKTINSIQSTISTESSNKLIEDEDENVILQRRRKWIGIFILFAIITIMGSTGINAYLNKREV